MAPQRVTKRKQLEICLFVALMLLECCRAGDVLGAHEAFETSSAELVYRDTDSLDTGLTLLPAELPVASPATGGSKATAAEVQELLSQATKELEPWKDGVSLEMVERLYCVAESEETLRIQIIKGRPYLVGPNPDFQSRNRGVQKQIMDLVAKFPDLPDVDFMVSTSDHCYDWSQPPKSIHGNSSTCLRNVSLPDFAYGGWPEAFMSDWQSTRSWMMWAAEQTPFEQRNPNLFWRGGITNAERKIMHDSNEVQDSGLADVHLVTWGIAHEQFKKEFKSLPEHCQHKYLLHLPGVTWGARLRELLLCGSIVVFPWNYDWEYKEFWYHLLRDRENVMLTAKVDANNQGRNVMDVVRELASNETLARNVAEKGQYLAAEILHPDNIAKYWVELLTQYSKLLTFQPTVHPDATPLEAAMMSPDEYMHSADRTCTVC